MNKSPQDGGDTNGDGDGEAPKFSLSQELSFNLSDERAEIEAETEAMAFYTADAEEETGREASAVPTSALYCSGGGVDLSAGYPEIDDRSFVAVAECRFGLSADMDDDMDEDSDDDSDDDEDDGHSSMLSTASLCRSRTGDARRRVGSGGSPSGADGAEGGNRRGRSLSAGYDIPRSHNWRGVSFLAQQNNAVHAKGRSSALGAALGVRGGGGSSSNELAQRLLVAALVTILYEAVLGHLLEFTKIVMQTSPPGTSYGEVLSKITAEKGLPGIWDGFLPWGVVQSIFKGGVFGLAHAMASSYLGPLADSGVMPKQLAQTLAGGIAGGFQGFVLSPTLLLKTRVMTNPIFRENMSLLRTTLLSLTIGMDVVRKEGILALMKGSDIFALKRVLDWSTRFYFSDIAEALLLRYSASGTLTNGEKIAASLLGGTASTISTLPLDVLVAKTQDAKKAGAKVSAVELLKQELEERGWKGVWDTTMQGFEARLAHVCFTTVVMKTFSPIVYDFLFGKK